MYGPRVIIAFFSPGIIDVFFYGNYRIWYIAFYGIHSNVVVIKREFNPSSSPTGSVCRCFVVECQTGFGHDGGKSSVQWDKRW